MDEIKELLAEWKNDSFINPNALEAAQKAVFLLVQRVEELESRIAILETKV